MVCLFMVLLQSFYSRGYKLAHTVTWNAMLLLLLLSHFSPTLCDPIDCSPPGSPIPGILQAITLEWAAISFSNAWKWKVKVKSLSRVRPSVTPWTAAFQAPQSMGFSRQEYWRGAIAFSIWLCGSQQIVDNSLRHENTRPPYLPHEKSVCRLGSNI